MKILVIGSGGREHALCWKIKQSPKVDKIYCAPGNAGIAQAAECVPIKVEDFEALAAFAQKQGIGLTVVGPEVPLAGGIVDYFRAKGLEIFGPDKKASQLEASKVFAKDLMKKYGVATASYNAFKSLEEALKFLANLPESKKLVVKADGLAAGKGVIICSQREEAENAVRQMMADKLFGAAGSEIVIEEFLEGEEVSVQIFLDGKNYSVMAAAQDHKRVNDNDDGPNTGGMGAYAPAPLYNKALNDKFEKNIVAPLISGFAKEGIDYRGVLYIGLMVVNPVRDTQTGISCKNDDKQDRHSISCKTVASTPRQVGAISNGVKGEPFVLEFNCRFGDPETEVVLPLLETDLVEIMLKINAKQLDKIKVNWYNKSAVCVVLASGGYPGNFDKGSEIKGLKNAAALKDTMVFHSGTAFKEEKIVTAGGRVICVTGLGDDLKEAIKTVYEAVSKISFDKMHYRTDIAKKAFK